MISATIIMHLSLLFTLLDSSHTKCCTFIAHTSLHLRLLWLVLDNALVRIRDRLWLCFNKCTTTISFVFLVHMRLRCKCRLWENCRSILLQMLEHFEIRQTRSLKMCYWSVITFLLKCICCSKLVALSKQLRSRVTWDFSVGDI